MQLHIPQPCGEDWNNMTPTGSGRHCMQCVKTVVDFTGMSAWEISCYLQLHAGIKVCGRFTEDQLARNIPTPEEYVLHVVRSPWPLLKQMAALVIFALFIGATPVSAQTKHKTASMQPEPQLPGRVASKQHTDTPAWCSPVMGKIALPPKKPQTRKQPEKPKPGVLQGDVQYVPEQQQTK